MHWSLPIAVKTSQSSVTFPTAGWMKVGRVRTIVNVSSGLGSFDVRADESRTEHSIPSLGYSASKAAVNMMTSIYAQFIPEIRINTVDPGYTATDLNANSGPQTVTEGTDAIVAMASIGTDGPTGTFTDRHGRVKW